MDTVLTKGDIPDIIKKFKTKAEGPQSFSIDFATIKGDGDYNLSIQKYRKNEVAEIEYKDPKKMIDSILNEEEAIVEDLRDLKGRL